MVYYLFWIKGSPFLVVTFAGVLGFFAFNVIPIAFEEAFRRLPPNCLITTTVCFTMSAQIVSSGAISFFGFLFSEKTRERAMIYALIVVISYGVLTIVSIAVWIGTRNEKPQKEALISGRKSEYEFYRKSIKVGH